jgi:hypothetical protein
MIEVKISSSAKSPKKDEMFGGDRVVVRYLPPGERVWQSRGVGDDYGSTKTMLQRMVAQVLRRAFPEVEEHEFSGVTVDSPSLAEYLADDKEAQEVVISIVRDYYESRTTGAAEGKDLPVGPSTS